MKKILLFVAIASAMNAVGQQHIVTYWDAFHQTKQEEYYLNANGEMNGKYVAYFSDGSINIERVYKNGKQNGKETAFYVENDRRGLHLISNFKDDLLDGLQQSYECSGMYVRFVCEEEFYKNGKLIWKKTYDIDDKNKRCLRKEELYNDGGSNPYLTKGYKQNGHQFYLIAKDGVNWQEADPRANKLEFYTANGKKDGLYKEWYDNGNLADSCYYKNDVQDGYEFQWYPNGKLKFTRNFTNGRLDGDVKDYDSTGKLTSTIKFSNGERPLTKDDIHGAIDLIRAGKYHEGDEALKQMLTKIDIEYDSVLVIVKLFMNCNSCGSYSNEWFDRVLRHYSDKLNPNDYISISKFQIKSQYGDAIATINSGLHKFPDNPELQSLYSRISSDLLFKKAHDKHVAEGNSAAEINSNRISRYNAAKENHTVYNDTTSNFYYKKWLDMVNIDTEDKSKVEEARQVITLFNDNSDIYKYWRK